MPLSSIANLLFKIFALNWILSSVVHLLATIMAAQVVVYGVGVTWDICLPLIFKFLMGVLLWFFSPQLSRFLTKANDGEFQLNGVTLEMLITTAIVSLGLYFFLSSVGEACSWIHFFAINKSPSYGFHKEMAPSYYDFYESLLTVLIGGVLVCTSRRIAAKICKKG